MTIAAFSVSNGSIFAPIAAESTETPQTPEAAIEPSTNSETPSSTTPASTENIPDDQLSLPLSLKQFQTLQTLIQKSSENATKLIDQFTKDTDDLQKKFNEFLDDLLQEPK